MNFKGIVALAMLGAVCLLPLSAENKKEVVIPVVGNTYVNVPLRDRGENDTHIDGKTGLCLRDGKDQVATSYIYVCKNEQPDIWIDVKGKGKLQMCVGKKKKTFTVGEKANGRLYFGKVKTKVDGYLRLYFQAKGEGNNIQVENIVMNGLAKEPIFLKRSYNTYFGLRGPSCHLNYNPSYKGEADWALISVCVPREFDKEGSYYMALGFDGGYFGFQNNGRGYRQVLFSVWNSGETNDDPNAVHRAQQTIVVNKGEGVTARNFGGEGSGKQSFVQVNWQPDSVYTFLLNARKVKEGYTDFSGWFYDSVADRWLYLSTLRRPNTNNLLRGLHSFLENFDPNQGDKTRKAYYFNGWVKPVGGDWLPITKAYLTNDDTGNRGKRLDFYGSTEGERFYLTNGGYFDRPENIERRLEIDGHGMKKPQIDLQQFTVSEP